jgi:hypothetical protein
MGLEHIEMEQLQKENERLTQLVDTLMVGYVGLFTANLRTGKIVFQKIARNLLDHFGIPGEIPIWEDYVSLYMRNGVYPDDQPMVRNFLDRDFLREHLDCGQSITKEYRNDRGVWGEMKLIRIDEDTLLGGTTLTNPQRTGGEKLCVRCFGNFDVFFHDRPLVFRRSKTKELLAYLVDREGAACTAEEIINALWEESGDVKNPKSYLRALTKDLRDTLASVGMEAALIREHNQWAIRKKLLDCDYYRLLEGDVEAASDYHGEYMNQYSWAEQTAARLQFSVST